MENGLKFQVHQISLHPKNADKAQELLTGLGLTDWFVDEVTSRGEVYDKEGSVHKMKVYSTFGAFDTNLSGGGRYPIDLEIKEDVSGDTWTEEYGYGVSHLGMYVTEEQLDRFRLFFRDKWIKVAEEKITEEHSHPEIIEKYRFHYVVFDTFDVLGIDLMFIVKQEL